MKQHKKNKKQAQVPRKVQLTSNECKQVNKKKWINVKKENETNGSNLEPEGSYVHCSNAYDELA